VKRLFLIALMYWVVMSILACVLYPAVTWDMVTRYAPMADAFARGEWSLAFHPRFGVLFSALAGSMAWVSGLSGIHCCQILAFFFLAASAIPTWWIMRRVFDERAAWIVVVLTWSVVDYLVPALDGYRESGRMLGIALCACAFVGARSWTLAVGLCVLASVRMDAWAVSAAILAMWCGMKVWRRDWLSVPLPVIGWTLGTAAMVTMTHAFTGYWLPAAQFVRKYVQWTGGAL